MCHSVLKGVQETGVQDRIQKPNSLSSRVQEFRRKGSKIKELDRARRIQTIEFSKTAAPPSGYSEASQEKDKEIQRGVRMKKEIKALIPKGCFKNGRIGPALKHSSTTPERI
jgi:hypothetical protein